MGNFSSTSLFPTGAQRALWTTLVFSLVSGMTACSSHKDDGATDELAADTAMVSDSAAKTDDGVSIDSSGGAKGGHHRFGSSRTPEIKEQPFQVGDQTMNAYYFVRSTEETWGTLSQLIYGRPDRADIIATWNQQGTLAVGRVIYYNSASRPTDSATMKVFAEDFGFGLQQMEVKKGDSLSQIAKALYGSVQSWKEIAALNPEIKNPDVIEVGQKLAVQPAQMNTKPVIDQLIAQAKQPTDNKVADTASASASDAPADEAVKAADAASDSSKSPQMAIAGLLHNKSRLIMIIGAGVILLGLAAVLLKRRAQNKNDRSAISSTSQVWDEGGNVTKLNRQNTNV